MSGIEGYRKHYLYEKDCNDKMLSMIESVPEANRSDPRFQQAVTLADHLAACRENWLDLMHGEGLNLVDWFNKTSDLATLRPRFAVLEAQWTDYLAHLTDAQLVQDFTFVENGGRYTLPTEVQIMQLVGHASYHRGQIALLVDQLGGETVDTDYVFWAFPEFS
ncbi:MAG: hypothetical protein JWL77_2071 [Chthonomonadaceae bacterium]|nr:hypothetical protein [Chthonomonadaceae bacterium]